MNAGMIYALLAYTSWGLLPLYWKLFAGLPAEEVLAHRIVWSFLFVVLLLVVFNKASKWKMLFRNKTTFWSILLASVVISAHWLLFIVAVYSERIVEASLGYFINPLVNVLLGVLFFKERPKKVQWFAIGLAVIGVCLLTISYGKLPYIALLLALSFGLYGLIKKKSPVESMLALSWETFLVTPIALGYIWWLHGGMTDTFQQPNSIYLLFAGVATALPLLWFAEAAKRLPLSTVGLFQYVNPSIALLIGVVLYQEPFSQTHLFSFVFIWCALIIYIFSTLPNTKKKVMENNG